MMGIITWKAVLRKSKYWIAAGNKNTRPEVFRIVVSKLKEKEDWTKIKRLFSSTWNEHMHMWQKKKDNC